MQNKKSLLSIIFLAVLNLFKISNWRSSRYLDKN